MAASHQAAKAPPASRHIPEIEGLRGIAILLIVVYHIWFNRVSGGVDVFFLLSGFLITASLMRATDHRGQVAFANFYARIGRRIVPPALLVLIGIVVAAVLVLPRSRWRETLSDVVATALYYVNWRLAENAVDYLASQFAASPVQHYWSLAVQAQFYLIWPLVIALAAAVAMRLAVRPRQALAIVIGAVFVLSLTYSIIRTSVNQPYAYFDTFARLWEFALGGLLALLRPYLRPGRAAKLALGWVGLLGLIACGMVFRAGSEFPGWAALWPTMAGVMIIVATGSGSAVGADRLLRSAFLRWLGGLAYALYLLHWPVLVYYLTATGRTESSLRGGVIVIIASLALAIFIKWLAEDRLQLSGLGQRTPVGGLALVASCVVVALGAAAAWNGYIYIYQQQAAAAGQFTEAQTEDGGTVRTYPGAAYLAEGGNLADLPYRPGPLDVRDDRAGILYPDCHQDQFDSEPSICEIGPRQPDRRIAVVGGSRAQHWLPALESVARRQNWQLLAITKSGCLFSGDKQYESCTEWNTKVMQELNRLRPDAVFTTSTRVAGGAETTPPGYLERWWTLDSLDIPVLAIRDVPRPLTDVPDCVEQEDDLTACGVERSHYALDRPAAVERHADVPPNVTLLDFTDFFCDNQFCPPIIGNVLVYHDNSHITATYARTLAPYLESSLTDAIG